MKRTSLCLAVLILTLGQIGAIDSVCALAAPPWRSVALFKWAAADPEESYTLTEEQGPWMIMAVTFSGDEADSQAGELVQELRTRYKLSAYTHEVQFDYSKGTVGRGIDQFGAPMRMKYQLDQIREIAVLVGNYSSVDDPAAQKVLKKLKYAHPDCLDLEKRVQQGKKDSRSLGALRLTQKVVQSLAESSKKDRGPMGHAFITTNPLLPDEYFVPQGLDPLVVKMNEPVKYSLLDCPGKYTCKVATFTGHVLIDQKLVKEVENGKEMPSRLEEAAQKAHELTLALRAKGYEAYEFHDRYASMVTVGSFNSVGTPRKDGKIEIDPTLHAIMRTFGADQQVVPGEAAPRVGKVKELAGIAFDIQPMPVEVPRRSIGRDYDRPLLGSR